MPRPCKCRQIDGTPGASYFKPRAVPLCELEEVELSLDEFEALRLADLDGLHQEEAAARMKVSRQTFGRIVENARRKVAQVLHSGMALSIEGGTVRTTARRCPGCGKKGHPGADCRRKTGGGCDR